MADAPKDEGSEVEFTNESRNPVSVVNTSGKSTVIPPGGKAKVKVTAKDAERLKAMMKAPEAPKNPLEIQPAPGVEQVAPAPPTRERR
jgi:hypothetical protein